MISRPFVWSVTTAVVLLLVVGAGISLPQRDYPTAPGSAAVQTFPADDQIFNDAGSAPEVSSSLVEGGLSDGTIDAGGNRQDDPLFADDDGADNIPGSVDDNVALMDASPAVDRGDENALPQDIFDIDGDGNTTEPFPVDIFGEDRAFEGGEVDMGAHESMVTSTSTRRPESIPESPVVFEIPYPNPVRDRGELNFSLPTSERVQVAVFDALGRKQMVLFEGIAEADRAYRLDIPALGLASGVYFARLTGGAINRTSEFVVVR